jgi:hypothetical protein
MALLQWPDEPSREPDVEPETDLERVPVPAQPGGGGADLEDDAYAPARAYVSDSAPDTEPAASEPARGQASVAAPLWPEPEKKKPRRRG